MITVERYDDFRKRLVGDNIFLYYDDDPLGIARIKKAKVIGFACLPSDFLGPRVLLDSDGINIPRVYALNEEGKYSIIDLSNQSILCGNLLKKSQNFGRGGRPLKDSYHWRVTRGVSGRNSLGFSNRSIDINDKSDIYNLSGDGR